MSSPARKHFERTSAASSKAAEAEGPTNANGYELMLYKLAQDKRRLHDIQSMESRADVKRGLLPEYEPWIEGVLKGEQGVQDDVLMTVMVWRIDAGEYFGALEIARYAIKHKLAMPDQYKRTTATIIAEEIAEAAIKAHDSGTIFDVEPLILADEITSAEDMPDEVRAKLLKAIGYGYSSNQDDRSTVARAIEYFKRAFGLHDKVGVKKDIEKLERELKNSTAANGAS